MILKRMIIRYMVCAGMAWISIVPAHAASLEQLMTEFGVQQPEVHKPAPDFSLPDLAGNKVSLSDYRGTLVLLHFWATWCVPCRHEMPLLHRLEHDVADGIRVVCVNVDRGNKAHVQAFIDEVTPHFHSLLDPAGAVRNRYAVRGLPTTYLIGRDGNIIGRIIGERNWSSPGMKEMIQSLAGRNAH